MKVFFIPVQSMEILRAPFLCKDMGGCKTRPLARYRREDISSRPIRKFAGFRHP
jgi:hypothetical protein